MAQSNAEWAMNERRAQILAGACGVSSNVIHRWQRNSGLSWTDFWLLANEVNLASMADADRAAVDNAVAASRAMTAAGILSVRREKRKAEGK